MKKISKLIMGLIVFTFISIGVSTQVFASAPAELDTVVSGSSVRRGDNLSLSTYVTYGNIVQCLTDNQDCEINGIHFDSNIFEFVSFSSNYIGYNGTTQVVDLSNPDLSGSGIGVVLPFYVQRDDTPVLLWQLTLNVKDDAVLGGTTVYNQNITILDKATTQETTLSTISAVDNNIRNQNNILIYVVSGLIFIVIVLVILLVLVKKKSNKQNTTKNLKTLNNKYR